MEGVNSKEQFDPSSLTVFPEMVQTSRSLMVIAEAVDVKDEDSNAVATDFQGRIKSTFNQFETLRKVLTAPLNKHISNINQMFKAATDPLLKVRKILNDKQVHYLEECEKKRLEEEKKRKEEAERKVLETAEQLESIGAKEAAESVINSELARQENKQAVKPAPTRTQHGTSFARKDWTFVVIDEAEVPRRFFDLNESKVLSVIRSQASQGKKPSIPGIRAFQKMGVVIR